MAPAQGVGPKRARTGAQALSSDGLQMQGSQLDSLLDMIEQAQGAGPSETRCKGTGPITRALMRVLE